MTDIAHGVAGRKPLPASSSATLALLNRLAGGAVPLAELSTPADRDALAVATRRGCVRLHVRASLRAEVDLPERNARLGLVAVGVLVVETTQLALVRISDARRILALDEAITGR